MPMYVPPARGKPEPSVIWVEPMSRSSRNSCILLIVIGLLTFFAPSISTDTPVLGRSDWSPFEIFKQIHAGALPVKDVHPVYSPTWRTRNLVISITTHYLLMVVTLAFVLVPAWPELAIPSVVWGALIQANPVYGQDRLGYKLQPLFYSSQEWFRRARGWDVPIVHATQYQLLLLFVNALLFGVLLADITNRKRPLPYASSTGLRDVEDLEATLAAMPDVGRAKNSSED